MSNANYYASLTPKPAKKRGAWMVILVTSLLVVVPVVIKEIPREHARWHQAAAREYLQQEKFDLALQQVERAIELDKLLYTSYLLRAKIYKERYKSKEGDGLLENMEHAFDSINRAKALAPPEQLRIVEVQRADMAHELGLWKVAASEYKRILQAANFNIPARAHLLNGSAYNSALANIDLDTALADIEEALDLVSDYRGLGKETLQEIRASCLDTRGYIHFQRGEYRLALEDSEQSIQLFEPLRKKNLEDADNNVVRASERKKTKADINRTWAVLLYHRKLVNDMLAGEEPHRLDYVAEDEAAIKALGFEVGPHLY